MVFFFVTCSYQHRLYVVGNLVFIVGNLVLLDVMDIIVIELDIIIMELKWNHNYILMVCVETRHIICINGLCK